MTTSRLICLIAALAHGHLLMSCKAKCLHGYRMEGTSCKKIVNDAGVMEDAGNESDATLPENDSSGSSDAALTTERVDSKTDAGSVDNTSAMPDAGQLPKDAGRPATGMSNSASQVEPQACDNNGAMRCSVTAGQRGRQSCQGNVWVPGEPCAVSETCVMDSSGATCTALEQLCVGSNGKPVCDGQGQMLLCNQDGTVRAREMCISSNHCEAGLALGECPACLANEEYRCTGASLELCAADGMSFIAQMECPSAALCNASLGMCSAAVCLPGMFACANNVLTQCKSDSTGFDDATAMSCGVATCDAEGGDCNMCQPGRKSCMGNNAVTCDSTGQRLDTTPCASGMKCIGAGQCVACTEDSDCGSLDSVCKIGACEQYRCVAQNAPRGATCTTNGRPGTCSNNGSCECTPQCNKPCGEDGCGNQCPNTCGSQMCVDDECVECTSSSQCDDSDDGCQVGVCDRNGDCTLSSAGTEGDACRVNNTEGTCSAGRCVPTPPPPPPSENWVTCNSEANCSGSPNTTCHVSAKYCVPPCGSNNTCAGGRSCLEGWCLIMPSCPEGLSEIEIDAYTESGKALICATPGGV